MNYQKIYNKLVEYRQQYPATGYVERHHILPKSMGGSDDPSNLVVLTGREHWVAHLLLWKVYRNSQTIQACHMMAMRCKVRGISKVRSSRMYETLRIEHAKLVSERHKITQLGEGNSQYATRWICSNELQQNKKISKDDEIPDGWILGRNKWKPSKPKARKTRLSNGLTIKQDLLAKKQTKEYNIDGVIFFGLKSICVRYNLTHPAVIYRLKSSRFPTWKSLMRE